MKKYVLLIAASAMIASSGQARKPPQLTGLELQQIQARDFEAPKDMSFAAVMTVLQDSGYRIGSADRDTGLITGSASTNSNTTWLPFVGFGRSKKTPVVSAFIESRGIGSRIRLNFVLSKSKSMMYGLSSSDEQPITDAIVYQSAFEKIEKEVFVRQSLKSAPSSALPATDGTAPVAPVTPATVPSGK